MSNPPPPKGGVLATGLLTLGAVFCLTFPAQAADRTNVPLRNWGGFAINRHWTYDAIEKLVLAGLTDRVVLNTKPMSRLEMAKVVAQVVRKLRGDDGWLYNDRQDLEDLLYRLVEEFEPELAQLGVKPALQGGKPHGFFFVKPLDQLQVRGGVASEDAPLENSQGDLLSDGVSSRVAFFSRAQGGDFVSLALQPEVRLGQGGVDGRLLEGYVKFTKWGLEVEGGRESLWWGPGFHGSMLFSNNAPPFDLIKFASAEPFTLPFFFKYLGPMKVTFVLGRLDENRDFPNTKLAGMRLDLAPFPFLEVGLSRVVQFDGRRRPALRFIDYPRVIFGPGSDSPNDPLNNNTLLSADATFRLWNVSRYIPLFRDLEIYGELGWDDTCCEDIFIPLRPGGIVGIYTPNLFRSSQTELRVEYAATSRIQFTHGLYTTGYSFKGRPISHFIGTEGSDFYVRVGRWLGPDLLFGLELDRARIGPVAAGTRGLPREKRFSAGFDLSYRFLKNVTFFGAYRFSSSDNLGSIPGQNQTTHLIRLEVTYSF